jgi:MFS family permease
MVLVLLLLSPNEAGWSLGWAMLGDFFGRRNFATLRGGMIALQSLMGVGSPLYSGWIYDTTGSYSLVILPAVVLIVASGLAVWFLPRPRRQLVTPAGGR